MKDYATLIDAETWAFIERTDSFYPPDTIDMSIADQRAVYDRLCRAFFAGYPDGVEAKDGAIRAAGRDMPIRIYRTAASDLEARIVYFHGGGFMLGGLDSHDDICAELCARTGMEVVAVDYRLAPEHKHPAAFDDALAAFEWATGDDPRQAVLVGDSAGGTLAAAVSHATRGHKRAADGPDAGLSRSRRRPEPRLLCRACRGADADGARPRLLQGDPRRWRGDGRHHAVRRWPMPTSPTCRRR